jgi:hypothetical protein
MREEILNKGLELSELIETASNAVMELSLGIEDHKATLSFVEAQIMQEIASETDDKGKPVFSNDASRSAELLVRKRSNGLIKEGLELQQRSVTSRNKLQNELEKYRNQLSLYKAFLSGGAA